MIWKTSISQVSDGEERVRGYELKEMIGHLTFGQTIWLVLKGDLPSEAQVKMLEAMLVSGVEHSIGTPSAMAARLIASGGSPLNSAVAGGLLALGDYHGGAIEGAAKVFQEAVKNGRSAAEVVAEMKNKGERVPGFGHRVLTMDPRAEKLIALAKELNLAGPHVQLAEEILVDLNREGSKNLPLNIDGAMAAILSDMGFPWDMMKGIFIIARVPGLVAQVYEEMKGDAGLRRLSEDDIEYVGENNLST